MKPFALLLTAASAAALCACGGAGSSATTAAAPASPAAPAPAAAPAAAAPAPATAPVLTPEGWGPVRVAMSEAQALEALGDGWRPDEGSGEPTACHFLRSGAQSPVVLMVENGRVSRITVQATDDPAAATPRTERGVGLEATEAEVRAAYTGVREEPDRYDPSVKSLYWWSAGAPSGDEYVQNEMARGLRFEIGRGGRVTAIHAGGPSIQLAEGCS